MTQSLVKTGSKDMDFRKDDMFFPKVTINQKPVITIEYILFKKMNSKRILYNFSCL